MVLENKWYEADTVQDSGFFTDLQSRSREKIVWFPKIYYQMEKGLLHIRCEITLGKYQDQLLRLEDKLESGLYCELTDKTLHDGYIEYILLYDMIANRITIDEVRAENGCLRLMKNLVWEYDALPHALIAGGTGGGKTYFLLTLIEALLHTNAVLYILDPKNADLADLGTVMGNVYHTKEEMIDCVNAFYEGMVQRSEEMKRHPNYKTGENYAYLGLPPCFLIFDEYVAFFEMLGTKESVGLLSQLKKIVMLGRQELREKRIAYGISQGRLALASGITREYLNKIESGKMKPSKELLETLHKELARFNPEAPLTMLFDYVKIRFPTLDIQHIIKDILKLNINYMLHEDYGHYSYTEHYSLGDIFIYTSADEEKGVLLELKGRGCRQFESYLLAQERSWYDFLMDALVDGGVMKRIDLAINDHMGILDIPELAEKCRKREYIGKSRSYKFYLSGELIKHREDDREYMGRTLYLGSLKSDVYFCIYEKDYEQYVKFGIPLEEADIINRFEIRLRNERAYYAVRDLLTYYDAEQTAFSIINQYVRFVDEEPDKRKSDWKLNDRWAWFIGDNRQSLKLTTKPEPYTLDRTLRWVQRQVAPTLKMLKKIDKGNGTDYMETIEQQAKLTEKHEMIIKQQTTPAKDLVES